MIPVPDCVLEEYREVAERMHGSTDREMGDDGEPDVDDAYVVGETDAATIYRLVDGWGETYVAAPKKSGGPGEFIAMKMPDVMAVDLAPKYKDKIAWKDIGMGDTAWDKAVVEAMGGTVSTKTEKAEWTSAHINDLPDSSFAYIEPGGTKDEGGKTAPRVLRHLPYRDAAGKVDLPHLRNALARLDATNLPKGTKDKVRSRLESVAGKHDVGDHSPAGEGWKKAAEKGADHAGCLEKGAACSVEYPVCPADPAHRQSPRFKAEHPGSRVQTLIFDREKYPKAADAKAWAKDHGFSSGDVDETEDSYRLRQEDPDAFARMRTISMTEGVQAVVGFPKESVKAIQAAFLRTAAAKSLVFKAEDLAATDVAPVEESEAGTIFRVKCADARMYFAVKGEVAVYVPDFFFIKGMQTILKSADEQRYTLGVVYPAKEVDFHGDYMTEAELEKAAWNVMQKGDPKVGLMHRPGTAGAGTVVESYIYRGPAWTLKGSDGEEQTVDPGDWLMGVVWNEEAWKSVKAGHLKGYSLQGAARKQAFDESI